jgi:hypothetical protein
VISLAVERAEDRVGDVGLAAALHLDLDVLDAGDAAALRVQLGDASQVEEGRRDAGARRQHEEGEEDPPRRP